MNLSKRMLVLVFSSLMLHAGAYFAQAKIITNEPSNAFGYALLQSIVEEEAKNNADKNIFISPASASLALSMLLQGASTSTYKAIEETLLLKNVKAEDILKSNQELIKALTSVSTANSGSDQEGSPLVLNITNSIWTSVTAPFNYNPSYVSDMKTFYSAEVEKTDFKSQAGVDAINQWASDKTNEKIKNIIDLDVLQELWFVLMNATYFKASWSSAFTKALTKKEDFTTAKGAKVQVDMMTDSSTRRAYYEDSEVQVVELAYKGNTAAMYAVLPKGTAKLSDVLAKKDGILSKNFWDRVKANTEYKKGLLQMPKFSFPYSIKLNDILENMGMAVAFTDDADFSKIGKPATKVGLVKQDTFVKVDEEGTEAAAVTFVGGIERTSIDFDRFTFVANKPFLVSIVKKGEESKGLSDTVLFLGVVNKPEWK